MVEYSAFNRFVLGSSPRQPTYSAGKLYIYAIQKTIADFNSCNRVKFSSFTLRGYTSTSYIGAFDTIKSVRKFSSFTLPIFYLPVIPIYLFIRIGLHLFLVKFVRFHHMC